MKVYVGYDGWGEPYDEAGNGIQWIATSPESRDKLIATVETEGEVMVTTCEEEFGCFNVRVYPEGTDFESPEFDEDEDCLEWKRIRVETWDTDQ